jgi:C-terminal processing protease CtpA/Prc
VNWKEVREKYRPQVTDKTTPQELFDIFKAMVTPLGDAHVSVRGSSSKQRYHGTRKDSHVVDDKTDAKAKEIIETKYLHGKLKSWCNGRVSYGLLPDAIGYLRITAFSGYTNRFDFDDFVRALDNALDKVFEGSDKLKGLVIDVRINHGGSDVLGATVASRLAANEYLAFAKKTRSDPRDPSRFTDPQDTPVPVSTRPHFHGKVVELIGGTTISAGETFTMALMGRIPKIVRIGENTQGVFSDVLGRKLPNGLRFGLPNEIFLTKDGKAFDGPGIPPDVPCPVFPKEDLDKGRDGCLEKAIKLLKAA